MVLLWTELRKLEKLVSVELIFNLWYNDSVKEVSYELWQT